MKTGNGYLISLASESDPFYQTHSSMANCVYKKCRPLKYIADNIWLNIGCVLVQGRQYVAPILSALNLGVCILLGVGILSSQGGHV